MPWKLACALSLNVDIQGVSGNLLVNVRSFMDIVSESKTSNILSPVRIEQLHKKATEQIKRALQPFGYYRVKVVKSLEHRDDSWTATYKITPGEPIRISAIDISLTGEGKTSEDFVQLVKHFPLHKGDVLLDAKYEQFKTDLRNLALANGYLDAKFVQSEIRVDLEKYNAQIILIYHTGPRYRFGKVTFVQIGEQLDEQFLRRYLPFKEGDPYSTAKLLQLQRDLSDSDLLSRIEINQRFKESHDLKIPLELKLTPRKPKRYKFGVGYGTDTGARASVVHQRLISPKGHVLILKANVSEQLNRVDAQYLMPLRHPASEQFTMNAHYLEQTTLSRVSKAFALDLRRTTGTGKWLQALAVTYERESYTVGDENGSTQLIMPNINWIRSVYNNRIYPTRGSRMTTEIWISNTSWYSDVNFLQMRLSGKWIFPLGSSGRLLLRADGGGTMVNSIDQLPASKRFYAGGAQSIRGYGYEELGPHDAQGNILGGKYLGVGSIEYEHHIYGNWGAAIFYDAGDAFNDVNGKVYRGTGVGVRWRSGKWSL